MSLRISPHPTSYPVRFAAQEQGERNVLLENGNKITSGSSSGSQSKIFKWLPVVGGFLMSLALPVALAGSEPAVNSVSSVEISEPEQSQFPVTFKQINETNDSGSLERMHWVALHDFNQKVAYYLKLHEAELNKRMKEEPGLIEEISRVDPSFGPRWEPFEKLLTDSSTSPLGYLSSFGSETLLNSDNPLKPGDKEAITKAFAQLVAFAGWIRKMQEGRTIGFPEWAELYEKVFPSSPYFITQTEELRRQIDLIYAVNTRIEQVNKNLAHTVVQPTSMPDFFQQFSNQTVYPIFPPSADEVAATQSKEEIQRFKVIFGKLYLNRGLLLLEEVLLGVDALRKEKPETFSQLLSGDSYSRLDYLRLTSMVDFLKETQKVLTQQFNLSLGRITQPGFRSMFTEENLFFEILSYSIKESIAKQVGLLDTSLFPLGHPIHGQLEEVHEVEDVFNTLYYKAQTLEGQQISESTDGISVSEERSAQTPALFVASSKPQAMASKKGFQGEMTLEEAEAIIYSVNPELPNIKTVQQEEDYETLVRIQLAYQLQAMEPLLGLLQAHIQKMDESPHTRSLVTEGFKLGFYSGIVGMKSQLANLKKVKETLNTVFDYRPETVLEPTTPINASDAQLLSQAFQGIKNMVTIALKDRASGHLSVLLAKATLHPSMTKAYQHHFLAENSPIPELNRQIKAYRLLMEQVIRPQYKKAPFPTEDYFYPGGRPENRI